MAIYKRTVDKKPNVTVVGSPTIVDGVVSGFSASNYLQIPNTFSPTTNTWEIKCKVKTGSSITDHDSIFGSVNDGADALWLETRSSNHWGLALTSGSRWSIADHVEGSYTLLTNTDYWLSLEFTGSQYLLKYSTDGVNYVTDITVNSTANIRSLPLLVGAVKGGDGYKNPFNGSIDLSQSYININGERWWNGIDYLAQKIKDVYKSTERKYYKYGTEPNATVVGSYGKIVNGVASGFSTSQYLKLPTAFNPQSNPWEALFKVKINTLINGSQIILGQRNSGGYDFYVDVNTVRLGVGNTIFTGTTTLQENTTYWFKYVFTGDAYIVKSSTNGVDWVDEINTASTVTTTPTSDDCRIGVWYNTYDSGLGNPWLGSIDLSQSYININGARWWSGDSYTKAGSWIDEGVVSGFSTSQYLTLPKTVSDYNNLEVNIKIKASSLGTLCDCLRFENGGVIFLHTNNYLGYDPANVASTLYPEIDTWYYIKFTHDSSTYTLSYSLDGREYIDVATSQNTTKSTGAVYVGGSSIQTARYWRGSIDFTKSYIKINDKIWWNGTKAYEVNLGGEDVYEDWKQPILTSNGTLGGDKFAVAQSSSFNSQDFWKLFSDSNLEWHSAAGLPQWVSWYNPKPLRVTKLSFVGAPSGNIDNGIVQACNDNSNWVDIVSFSNTNSAGDFEIDLSSNDKAYKYWRIYITSCYYYNSGNAYSLIAKGFNITAQELVAVGSDSYDYSDVFKKRIITAYKTGDRKYYKRQDWTQPVLTSNTSSSIMTVSATNEGQGGAWQAFNRDYGGHWCTANQVTSGALTAVLNKDIYITSIEVQGLKNEHGSTNTMTIYSDANKQNVIGEHKSFNYSASSTLIWNFEEPVKANTLVFYGTGSGWVCIMNIKITAQGAIESTSSDYDFSEVPNQRVYNLKYNLNSSSAYAKEGVVSGSDMFGADRGMAGTQSLNQTSVFTFNTPAPSGKYTGSFVYYSQVNFTMSQVYWRLTYEDGTQEYAYGPTGLGDTAYGGGETATLSLSFTAKKPIKAVTVYANGSGGGSGRYGGLGSIQMFFDGSKQ